MITHTKRLALIYIVGVACVGALLGLVSISFAADDNREGSFTDSVVACAGLTESLLPKDTERNTVIDLENERLHVQVPSAEKDGKDVEFTVDYASDAACARNAAVQEVYQHARDTAMEALREECPSLISLSDSGSNIGAHGRPIDRAALKAHIDTWCS